MKDYRVYVLEFGLITVCIYGLIGYNMLTERAGGNVIVGPKNDNINSVIVLIE